MPHERDERKEINFPYIEKCFLLIGVPGAGIIVRIPQGSKQRLPTVSAVKKQDPREECCMEPRLAK